MQNNVIAYQQVLDFIGIKGCFFSVGTDNKPVRPLEVYVDYWIVIAPPIQDASGHLNLQCRDSSYIQIPVICREEVKEGFSCLYRMTFSERLPEEIEAKLNEYRSIIDTAEKRSEERFDIGLKKFRSFGLSCAEQKLYANSQHTTCILNDVSMHGAAVTGFRWNIATSGMAVKLCVTFGNPQEVVLQTAVIVHVEPKTEQLSRYSLQFIDPVSLVWQKRLSQYLVLNI